MIFEILAFKNLSPIEKYLAMAALFARSMHSFSLVRALFELNGLHACFSFRAAAVNPLN